MQRGLHVQCRRGADGGSRRGGVRSARRAPQRAQDGGKQAGGGHEAAQAGACGARRAGHAALPVLLRVAAVARQQRRTGTVAAPNGRLALALGAQGCLVGCLVVVCLVVVVTRVRLDRAPTSDAQHAAPPAVGVAVRLRVRAVEVRVPAAAVRRVRVVPAVAVRVPIAVGVGVPMRLGVAR